MHGSNRPKKNGNHARTNLMLAVLAIGNGLAAYAVVKQMNPDPRSVEDTSQGSELYAYKGLRDFPDKAVELAYRADNFGESQLASAVARPQAIIAAAVTAPYEAEIRQELAAPPAPRHIESRTPKRQYTQKVEYNSSKIVSVQRTFDTVIAPSPADAAASSPPQLVVIPPAVSAPIAAAPSATDQGLADPVLPYPLFGSDQPVEDELSGGGAPQPGQLVPDPIASADEGLRDGDPVQAVRVNPSTEPGIPISTPMAPQSASAGSPTESEAPLTLEGAG